ncbi:sigma-70 family RNA polymerase sigma factor [Nocardia pseudovaccinii]|uniref:sigma-70 family RNA polymerase sigma factor n=1 Tax=Nocardia pseudovaccinii TaxID=189540 RepID=UPI0007A4641E|nr:sigma-70 family RNA polymerase sigma factor [Nocardia pseudovaccinii]
MTDETQWLAQRFEDHRAHLGAVAYRMLGSANEADDAVQQAWLRFDRADTAGVRNLRNWLTAVVAHICLDMLRARKARREDPVGALPTELPAIPADSVNPEEEAVLADSVGLALLVVLDTLTPAERLTFVLHDLFDLPYAELAPILGRTPAAAAQLAARARRRVRGAPVAETDRIADERVVVDAFLQAARAGDFEALIAVLDPDVELHADAVAAPSGHPIRMSGARRVASSALMFSSQAPYTRPAVIDGHMGLVVAPNGNLNLLLAFTITGQRITTIDIIADPNRIADMSLAVPDET